MTFERIDWDLVSDPPCNDGDILVLVQYGAAEIVRYVTPKPRGAPRGKAKFILEVCDNDDGLEDEVMARIAERHPELLEDDDTPRLFTCPVSFSARAVWD